MYAETVVEGEPSHLGAHQQVACEKSGKAVINVVAREVSSSEGREAQ